MDITNIISLSAILCSCIAFGQNTHRKNAETKSATSDLSKIKVVNTLDPICKMKTTNHLSDTAVYKNKIYGFCSVHCNKEFNKNPKKYTN